MTYQWSKRLETQLKNITLQLHKVTLRALIQQLRKSQRYPEDHTPGALTRIH